MFHIMRMLGHEIAVWDEEALVQPAPQQYYQRRLSAEAMRHVSTLFAWGEENAGLFRKYPDYPGTPIHVTGNPRSDLLRPEMHAYYAAEVEKIRRDFGNFILINTNFNHVNAFGPDMNLFKPVKNPGETPKFGRAARGMSREYAEGLRDHKLAVFADFQRMIPRLEKSFPDHTIVVRPHPTESHEAYRRIASECRRVRLELLLRKDPTGHWYSTPRLLAKWQDAIRQDVIRTSLRRCPPTESRPPILPTDTRAGEGRLNSRKGFGEMPAGAGRHFSEEP